MATIKIKRRSYSHVARPIFGNLLGVRRNTHCSTSSRHPIVIKAQKISVHMKCPGSRIKSYANRVPKKERHALKRKRIPVIAQEPEPQESEPQEAVPQELSSNVFITALGFIIICGILAFGLLNSDYGKTILPEGFSSIVESFYKFANMCVAIVEGLTAKFKEPEVKPTWSSMISNAFGWFADPPQNQGGFLNSIWNWCAAMFGNTTAPATPEGLENPDMWQNLKDWLN